MSDISTEELLKVLGVKIDSPKTKAKGPFNKFIEQYDICESPKRISNSVIYYVYYKLWDYQNKYKLKRIPFFRELSKHFTSVRTGKNRGYLLKFNKLSITKELIQEAKLYDQEKKRTKKKTRLQQKLQPKD